MLYHYFVFGIDDVQMKRGDSLTAGIGAVVLETDNCHMISLTAACGVKRDAARKTQSADIRNRLLVFWPSEKQSYSHRTYRPKPFALLSSFPFAI